MKISSNNWSVKNLEKTYQQISPRIKKTEQNKPAEQASNFSRLMGFKKTRELAPADILSKEEKMTLKRLFEYDTNFAFYGRSNNPRTLSGMLLDVTG